MNLHTPERGANETREAYAARRRESKRASQVLEAAHFYGQHRVPSAREKLRDAQRARGAGPKGTFADAIGWNAAYKRREAKRAEALRG